MTRLPGRGTLRLFTNIHCIFEQFTPGLREDSNKKTFPMTFFSFERFATKGLRASNIIKNGESSTKTWWSTKQSFKRLWKGNSYRVKRKGSKIDLCSTPLLTSFPPEKKPSTITLFVPPLWWKCDRSLDCQKSFLEKRKLLQNRRGHHLANLKPVKTMDMMKDKPSMLVITNTSNAAEFCGSAISATVPESLETVSSISEAK